MALLTLHIDGVQRGYAFLTYGEEMSLPATFEAEVDPAVSITEGSDVEIKEGTTTIFKGIITSKTNTQSFDLRIGGPDAASKKLMRFFTDDEVFEETEPLEIAKVLITPNKECGGGIVHADDFKTDDGGWFGRRGTPYNISKGRCYFEDNGEYSGSNFFNWLRRNVVQQASKARVIIKPLSRYDGDKADYNVGIGVVQRLTGDPLVEGYYLYIGSPSGEPGDRKLILVKISGTAVYTLASTPYMFQWDRSYEMEFICIEDNLIGKIRESGQAEWTVISATDSTWTGGRTGILSSASRAEFRSFRHVRVGTATASSNSDDAWLGVDGDDETYWESGEDPGSEWWKLHLAVVSLDDVCRVQLKQFGATSVTIATSENDVEYATVYQSNSPNGQIEAVFSARLVSYVKITLGKAEGTTVGVYEVRVYQATEGGSLLTLDTATEYGAPVHFEVRDERRSEALKHLAESIGHDVWTTIDGKLHFGIRGSQSATATFQRGENIHSLEIYREADQVLYKVRVAGWGEGWAQVKVEAVDNAVRTTYPNLFGEHVETVKDIAETTVLQEIANKILAAQKAPREDLALLVDGEAYPRTGWQPGDNIHVEDSELGINGNYRVTRIVSHGLPPVCEVDCAPWDQTRYGAWTLEKILAGHRRGLKIFEKMGKSATEAPIVKPLSELVGTGGVTEGSGIYFGKIEDPTEVSHTFTVPVQWDYRYYICKKVFLGTFSMGVFALVGCGSETCHTDEGNGGGAFCAISTEDLPLETEIDSLGEFVGWFSRYEGGGYGFHSGVEEQWKAFEELDSRPLYFYEGLWGCKYYGGDSVTAYARNRKGFYQIRGVKI